ncbi:TonB-dependent receptor [Janthinobacterium sp. SUN026]|uniref:TonB-dependent receptor n=1 Tax=Janthinobacterium sp. SUN026 TaxID=3002438 RepID=UPI0025B1BA09|nr:TonB-dependent receptor [Janthinobacterium sp. SUN026]MDN2673751.1 TonB-dependent receptor [Janthinobacterium sp. SUN026]
MQILKQVGALGLAVGAEHRRDKLDNPSLSGTKDGSIHSSYVAARGDSKVSAVFLEVLVSVIKTVELSGALRDDKYDRFSSTTPKLGASDKFFPASAQAATHSLNIWQAQVTIAMPSTPTPAALQRAYFYFAHEGGWQPRQKCGTKCTFFVLNQYL